MLTGIFAKSVRDRWLGMAIGLVCMLVLLLSAMYIYGTLDVNIYQGFPEALKNIMGIPPNADVASLAISVYLTGAGSWILVGLTIAFGSGAVASEENSGTIELLLANPVSRTRVLASKAAGMVVLMGLTTAALWGGTYAIARLLDTSIAGMHVGALCIHLLGLSLFFGFLALAIGAWTGKRGVAAGAPTGIMIISIFAAGILPLIKGWEGLARIFPWYYLDGAKPLLNGTDWRHIGILAAGVAVFAGLAVFGLNRRDLKIRSAGAGLLDRLRRHPRVRKILDRLAGSARVSGIWIKTLSDHQTLVIIVVYFMVLMGLVGGPIYNLLPVDTIQNALQQVPALVAALGGNANYGTPAGFWQTEFFSLTVPAAVMVVTIVAGAKAIAGEEEDRTLGLLLASPVPRWRIPVEKSLAMLVLGVAAGGAAFLGIMFGSLAGGLSMSFVNLAAACLLVTLVGLFYGAVALALGAATGKHRVAVFGSLGFVVVSYVASSFLPLSATLAGYAKWSPYYYFLGGDPLVRGLDWTHAVILAGLTLALVLLSIPLFQRRDLKFSG